MQPDTPFPAPERLLLPEVLDIRAAVPLAGDLLARRGLDLELNASNVRKLGAQCLQVLLSAGLCWQADDRQLTVEAPSAEFTDGAALLGAASLLPCKA